MPDVHTLGTHEMGIPGTETRQAHEPASESLATHACIPRRVLPVRSCAARELPTLCVPAQVCLLEPHRSLEKAVHQADLLHRLHSTDEERVAWLMKPRYPMVRAWPHLQL